MRLLRGRIHEQLGELIAEEVEKLSLDPHDNIEIQDSVVARITEKVARATE